MYATIDGYAANGSGTGTDPFSVPQGSTIAHYQMAAYPGMLEDQVRTVFITGFPLDIKERELHNLLRFLPGYEASQMNFKAGPPQGFALFASPAHAQAAAEVLQQLQFDDEIKLRCELAHKNMYLKEHDPTIRRATGPNPIGRLAQLTATGAAAFQAATGYLAPAATYAPMGPGGHAAGLAGLTLHQPAAMRHQGMGVGLMGATHNAPAGALVPAHLAVAPAGFAPVMNKGDNPPCNTLFIGNLSDSVDEEELRALFSAQPGYKQMKLVRGPKQVSCFVEYEDVISASAVHNSLQGAVLQSSDRGGIRVQYSRNPFGRRSAGPMLAGGMIGLQGIAGMAEAGAWNPAGMYGSGL